MIIQDMRNKLGSPKLIIGFTLAIALGYYLLINLIAYWPDLLTKIIAAQQYFHKLLSTHIKAVANNSDTYGWSLLGISFAYGVFHAAGPGHGKAIIVTYLTSQKESIKQGVAISFMASIFQSLIAIGLIVFLVNLLQLKFRDVTQTGQQVEQIGYLLVVLLGGYLALKAGINLIRTKLRFGSHHHHDHEHEYEHSEHCNHLYVPKQRLPRTKLLGIALSMGMRPCSGAILVLIYAQVIGVFWYGVLATLAIGLGTGLALAMIAVASVYARNSVQRLFSGDSGHGTHTSVFSELIAIAGGLILVFLGWSLYSVAVQVTQSHPLL